MVTSSSCYATAVILLLNLLTVRAFVGTTTVPWKNSCRPAFLLQSAVEPPEQAIALKTELIQKINEFRALQERDGNVSIDFGVKGGELNATSRAPQKIDYYTISKDVGDKAGEIFALCEQLANVAPLDNPTQFLGDKDSGDKAPLNGAWKLLFTNAADASFSKNSTRGDAKAQNTVNGPKGKIVNQITFASKDDGTEPALKQLKVTIKAIPVGPKRVELRFKYAKAIFTKFLFFKVRWALYIPVPAEFITRCIVLFSKIWNFGRKGKVKEIPRGYFDILYLDRDLRIHRTGQDNTFIQAKDTWSEATNLL